MRTSKRKRKRGTTRKRRPVNRRQGRQERVLEKTGEFSSSIDGEGSDPTGRG